MPTGFEKLVEHGFGPERRIERVPVDDLREAVTRYKRLVVLGEPGSGKTTTLRRLVYDYAVAAKTDPSAPLPVFVPLGGYSGPEAALDYAAAQCGELAAQLPAYLRSGRVVLLLDALNEMPRVEYKERVGRIQALLDAHKDVPIVVTCRALDYVETLKLEKLEVKPLEPEQQRAYLQRYLGADAGEKLFWQLAGSERQLREAQERGSLPPLLALGVNPFLLVMFAQVYAAGKGALPQNRGKLFAAFADSLLEREHERHKQAGSPGVAMLRKALAELAFAMQVAGERGTSVGKTWAEEQLRGVQCDATQVLYYGRSASLLEETNTEVRFVHQLLRLALWVSFPAAVALMGR